MRYSIFPFDELSVRPKYELDPGITTFVDCDTARSVYQCQEALFTLAVGWKFKHLFAIDLPRRQELTPATGMK